MRTGNTAGNDPSTLHGTVQGRIALLNFSHVHKSPGDPVKIMILIQQVCHGAQDFAVLESPQIMLMLLSLFKRSQTAEKQMLHTSIWHALTQRSKVKREWEPQAKLRSFKLQSLIKEALWGVAKSQDTIILTYELCPLSTCLLVQFPLHILTKSNSK